MNILDDKQQEVVLNNDQYLLVIASAGCGKTLTITYKVKYLLENLNYQPQDILCLSFTNEASLSLKKKLKENCNYDLEVKTFHKLALDMLKKSNYQFQIAPENFLSFFLDFFLKEKIFTYPFLMQLILKILKISFNSHNYQKKYQTLLLKKDFLKLINTITQYINLLKTLNYDLTDLKKNILKAKKQEQYLLLLMYALYLDYNNELCSLGLIDFNDMLIKALETNIILPYKFIIVDEYQDTSLIRFKLLQKIINKNQAHLMVVGDDYQSIYNFSGCSLDIFLNFSTYFPQAKILFLNNTYRNSQELINVATHFICQNKRQIIKKINSSKHVFKPIKLFYYQNKQNDLTFLIYKLSFKGTLLILGRNNFDLKQFLNFKIFSVNSKGNINFKNQKHEVRFLTVHKAKGLEADYVIILNLENHLNGFPSQVVSPKIFRNLNPSLDNYPYAEERRLFYVALTRCKNEVYLYVNKFKESIFVKELKKYYKKSIEKIKLSDTNDKD